MLNVTQSSIKRDSACSHLGGKVWRTILGEQVPRSQNLKSAVVLDLDTRGHHLTNVGDGGHLGPFAGPDSEPALPFELWLQAWSPRRAQPVPIQDCLLPPHMPISGDCSPANS